MNLASLLKQSKLGRALRLVVAERAHILGLALIATIAIGTHLVMDRLLAEERGKSILLDLVGEQRMLTERIKSLSQQLAVVDYDGDATRLEVYLDTAVNMMRDGHEILIRGDDTRLLPGVAGYPADEIYFGAEVELDRQIRTFLAAARSFLSVSWRERHRDHVYLDYMLGERGETLHASQTRAAEAFTVSGEQGIDRLRLILWLLLIALMLSIFFEWLLIYRPSFRGMLDRNLMLQRRADTDPLTGVANRYGFTMAAQEALAKRSKSESPVALIMLDIDQFKDLNDTYGHHIGDMALIMLAQTINSQLRIGDLLARLGGEEFVILLPNTHQDTALNIAERLRVAVRTKVLPSDDDRDLRITASFGVSEVSLDERDVSEALKRADTRMYAAKRAGRDRVQGVCEAPTLAKGLRCDQPIS